MNQDPNPARAEIVLADQDGKLYRLSFPASLLDGKAAVRVEQVVLNRLHDVLDKELPGVAAHKTADVLTLPPDALARHGFELTRDPAAAILNLRNRRVLPYLAPVTGA